MKLLSNLLFVTAACVVVPLAASAAPITSILDIVDGTTIDFEGGGNLNVELSGFDMTASPNLGTTSNSGFVTGNVDAPLSGRAFFSFSGTGTRIETTGAPWDQIGLTAMTGTLGESRTFTMRAFDVANVEIESRVVDFSPLDATVAAFNDAAVFLGISSATPIYAIELTHDNSGFGEWDNLRFHEIPEPSTLALLILSTAALVRRRRGFSQF